MLLVANLSASLYKCNFKSSKAKNTINGLIYFNPTKACWVCGDFNILANSFISKTMKKQLLIPYYENINDFFKAAKLPYRAPSSLLHCMELPEDDRYIYMPPFRRGFYFVGLLTTTGASTNIDYNYEQVSIPESFLVFQAPNLVYSFHSTPQTHGYLIYFKEEVFSFLNASLAEEFPVFDPQQTNVFPISTAEFNRLLPRFIDVVQSFENRQADQRITFHNLLATLYYLMDQPFVKCARHPNKRPKPLVQRYIQLIDANYIEKRTVKAYADLLNISEDHLSKTIKQVSGKTASSFLAERISREAKALVRYTSLTIAEIAYRLNFPDASNFTKFFKKHVGISPMDYRKP